MTAGAPRIVWTVERVAALAARAGWGSAKEIADELGVTVEQVRGAAKRRGISLKLDRAAERRRRTRISAGMTEAWADPAKRASIVGGLHAANARPEMHAIRSLAAYRRWDRARALTPEQIRAEARRAVLASGAPLLRALVDLAEDLILSGHPIDGLSVALRRSVTA